MNINLYQLILEQLLIFLEPITLAVNSDRNQDRLFAEIAWDINLIDDFPRTKLNEKLSKFVQEYQILESTINDPPKSFSEWLKALENAENALNTLQELKNELGELGNRIPQLQELDQDLIGFLIIRYLQNWRPQWYQLALLCNVINFDTTTLEPVADGNSIVRFPQRHPLIELEEVIPKITALLTNPVPTLKTIYFGASQRMENEADANAAADKLFPILGAFLQTLGAEVIYGWKAKEYGLDIGIAGEKLGRKMLTFAFVPDEGNNYFGATLSLSPKVIVNPEDNANVNSDLGLIVRPFGSFTPSEDEAGLSKVTFLWFAKDSKTGFKNTNSAAIIGIWEVEVQLTSGIEGFAIGPESATWLPANLSSVKGNIRLTKLLPSHEFAFILGSPIGSRLEIKSFQSFANINISQDTSLINYEVGINLENVALIFPEFLEIDIQQLEIALAKTQSRFKFKSFALSIPALFNQDIKGDLQLLFENGQLQLGSNQSYFKRFEPDEDNAITLPLDGIYFDQNCLILRWQERRINFWLKSLIPNFFDQDSQTNNNEITLRFLLGNSTKKPLQDIRLDWQITEQRTLTLPGINVILPNQSLWSLVIFFDEKNSIDNSWLIVTLPRATQIKALSNFSWKRDQERELQSNGNTQGENKPLFQLTLTAQEDVSLVLMDFEINQLKLPEFFAGQLTNPLQKFDLENPVNSELLRQPTDNTIINFKAENWEIDFDFNIDQFTFPFLQKSGEFSQTISLGKPSVKNKDLAKKVIELDIPITIEIGTLELTSNITVNFNWKTFALEIQHQEGIKIFINQDKLPKAQNYLGLEWTFISETEPTSDPIHFFTLVTQDYNYQLIQAPNTVIQLKYTSISKEPIVFEVKNFALTENGISLTAEITNQPVSLNGLETKFTFRNSYFEIKDNKIRDFTLKGSGPLPPALVGEAQADIALQFAQQNGSLTLVAGSAQLKASKTLYCEGIRFRFDIDALGLQFVNDGKFHLYFTLTGSAQFVPLASDDKDGPLALLSLIKIDLVQCPLTGDASVISKHVKFLIELPSKKSFNVLGCFEMELRAIGFKPQAEVFGGDGAIELTGQVKFAQGVGDTPNERADYHTLLIGLPSAGESIPRVYFKTLPVNLNVGEVFKLNGIVEFIQTKQEFSGEGSLEIQGLPPIAASFSYLRVRQNEQSPWLRAWFIYLEVRQVSFQIPIVQIYLREVGLGFGYRYTIASIKAADQAQDLRQLIQSLRTLSRTQGDLSKRDRWSVDLEDPGQDPRWTIALRALFSQTSASTSPLEYNSKEEEKLPCVYLFDAVVAFRSDLTFFMAVRGWINTNYDYYYKNRDIEPLFSGFALLAPRQKRFLAQLSSNPNGFTGSNPPLPSFMEKAIKNSQFSATILIEPGLIHQELGWPNMLRWSDSFGPLKAEIRGGFILRVSKEELVIGSSILARASLKLSAELDAGFVGARVSAEIDVAYGTRYIGVVNFANPTGNSALYAAVGLDARIRLSIEFWLQFTIKVWRWRKTIRKSSRFSVDISFTAALELGVNGLTPDQAGVRGSGTLSFSAMGHSLQLSVKFSANGERVQQALERTEKYLQLGLEATDVEPIPGLPATSVRELQPLSATPVRLLATDNQESENSGISGSMMPSDIDMSASASTLTASPSEGFPSRSEEQKFTVPGYVTFTIRKEKVYYFLLLPQGENHLTGEPERGFLPVPPTPEISVLHDFLLSFTAPIPKLQHFKPNNETNGGGWETVNLTNTELNYSWSVNWSKDIEQIEEYNPTESANTTPDKKEKVITFITLGDYLKNAFFLKKEVFNKDGVVILDDNTPEDRIPQQGELEVEGVELRLTPIGDPRPLPISTQLYDERLNNPSENNYEASVRGAFEQFRSSPFFKRDGENQYDRALGLAFQNDTTIYSDSGKVEQQEENQIIENQQIFQFRGTVIQDLIADFKEYVEAEENKNSSQSEKIASKSLAFQMGLVFKINAPDDAQEDSWIPDWLKATVDILESPKLQQRSQPEQTIPTEPPANVRLFNPLDLQFNKNPLQFKNVKPFTDANTIAIAWDIDWTKPLPENLTLAQRDPDHHLLHYRIRRIAIDDLSNSDREVSYAVKPCQVLHRQPGGLLKALMPRFKVVDHFNQETLENQANLPPTGLTYRYEITPVDMAGNASPNPLVVFATRYPNEPPQVPTDAEFIVSYQLESQIFTEIQTAINEKVPEVLDPKEILLEWTEPKTFKEGPNVPVGRYLLIFRRDRTLPIGSYGLDQQTQGDRQQFLPTSNARKLSTDIEIAIQRSKIESVQLRSETVGSKQGYRFTVSIDELKNRGILPRNGQWQPQSWRIFLQAEAFQASENQDIPVNPPRSALAPVRLLLRVTSKSSDEIPVIEEKRPSTLEWLAKPLLFPMLPPEDLADERGKATDRKEPDANRLARFPMPKLDALHFEGSLSGVLYQVHPNKIRCLRLRWNQGPSEITNYPLNLHAGYEILELDIDAHTQKTFKDQQELVKVLRTIQEVKLITDEDTLFTPSDTLTHNQWEAWYPSTLIRRTLERPEGSDLPLGAWYSWRESYLEWPQWAELEAQVKNQVGRPSLFHPCLQGIINILEANYIVDLQTSPPMQPNQFSDFLLATTASSDPYGWGVLQRLGLSVTFSLRLPLKGNLILGQDLLDAIKIALDTNFIITEKTLEEIRSLEISEKEKTLIKLSSLKDKSFTNQETFIAQLKDILAEQNLTDSDLEKIVNQAQRKQKDFYQYLHVELLFKPSFRIELEEKNPNVQALLGIVQLSLRPIPRQDLNYSQFKIMGAAGTTINLLFTFQGDPLSPFTLINQTDNSSGQIELEPSLPPAEPIQRTITITLPINGEINLLLRAKNLPDVKITIPLTNDIDSNKLPPNFSDFFELSDQTLKVKQSLDALTKEFRAQFAQELKNTGNDVNIAQLTFSQGEFLATDFLSTYFTYSAENLQKRFATDGLSQQWQQFQKYLLSLNSSDVNEPNKISVADIDKVENVSSFLSWSQRFFDYSPDIRATSDTEKPWLVTAYPRSTSPAYAVPDASGCIAYDHLIADQWAHNYRYYILPYGRYDLLLKSLRQSLFPDSLSVKTTAVKAELIDPQVGGLDIVLNRTHSVTKPLVLSSTRLDIQAPDKSQATAVEPGKIWEVIIAQHPEQTLIERNQTLVRQLGFRQIAYALLRRFAYEEWIGQLQKFLPETPEKFQAPSNYATPPNLPGKINTLDHLDLNQLTTGQALSLDLYQRLGDFQQGALVLQWEALPFYYEHRLLLIAQSVSVVSDFNIIKQQDFEYRTPAPIGVTVTGVELQGWKAPEKPIAFVQKIDGISLNSRSIKIPLRNFWDSLPEIAQIRWTVEKPANRGDNNSGENKYASLPDPEVVYQIVERFSGNIEVQAEIFCDISSDQFGEIGENGYKVRQLGRRFLVTVNQLNAPTHPQEDYLLNAGLIQITEETLQETYNFDNLAEPTKFKVRLEKQPDSPTKLFVANVFSKEDRENILAVANNQASEAFEKDRDSLNSLYQSWFSEEPISSKIDLAQLPQALQSVFDFSSSNNCNLIWEGTITEKQKEALLLLDGDDAFRLGLQRLSQNATVNPSPMSLTRETCPQEILPKPIPEALKNDEKTEFKLISEPESINLANEVWQLTWQLIWKGIMSENQQSELKAWAVIPEWQVAVTKLLEQLNQFIITQTLPPELSARPLNTELPVILQGKLNIESDQLIWLNVSLSAEEKEALNQLKDQREKDQDFKDAIIALITAIEQAITDNSSPPIEVTLNPIVPRPSAGNLPDSLKNNLTIEAEQIKWRGLIIKDIQRNDLASLSGDTPFNEVIQNILNSKQEITVSFVWRRRLLNLLQNISEKLLQIIVSKQIDTTISPGEQDILKDLKENLPKKLLSDLLGEQSQQLGQLLLESGDRQIFQLLKEKLSSEDRTTLGEILHHHLLIGNSIIRYHGIMTIKEGEELLKHYILPSSRRAIQRLYETTFNRGLQGSEIGIRTRRGSAKISELQLFEPTNLNI